MMDHEYTKQTRASLWPLKGSQEPWANAQTKMAFLRLRAGSASKCMVASIPCPISILSPFLRSSHAKDLRVIKSTMAGGKKGLQKSWNRSVIGIIIDGLRWKGPDPQHLSPQWGDSQHPTGLSHPSTAEPRIPAPHARPPRGLLLWISGRRLLS